MELEVPGVGDDDLGLGFYNYEIIEISESLDDPVTTQGSPALMIYHQTTQLKRSQAEIVIPTEIYPVTVTVIDTNNNNNNVIPCIPCRH